MIKSLLIGFILVCMDTYVANAQEYLLVFNASGPGSPPSNSGYYPKGTVVTATATPYGGSSFIGWTGSIISSSNPVNITVNSDMTVTANFGPLPKLTIISNPSGAGSFSPTSGSTYVGGTSLNITATPNTGYRFVNWSNFATGTNNPINITTALSDMTLTANFEAIPIAWQQNGTKLFFNVDNVGIGTENPETPLHVYGKVNNWKATFQGPDGYIKIGPANSGYAHIYTDRPGFIFNAPIYSMTGAFSAYSTTNLSLQTQGTTRLTVLSSNGNVGIGNSNPTEKLDVTGNIKATKFIGDGSGLTGTSKWTTVPNGIYFGDGYSAYVGIGESNPTTNLEIKSFYDVPPVIRLNYSDGTQLKWDIENDGNLIFKYGTSYTSPKVTFGASGDVKASKFIGDGSGLTGIVGLSQWVTNGSGISYANGNVGISGNLALGTDGGISTISGPGNSGAIQIKTNIGLGGVENRYLRLGWKDNNSVFSPVLSINDDLNVGIGTTTPAYKLDVCGTIRAQEIKVDLLGGCDFVFKNDYNLMDLNTLEEFVKTNHHLPEIASEKEMVENGVNMKEFQMKLLQKIEELTLYTIEQNKKIQALEEKIEKLSPVSK